MDIQADITGLAPPAHDGGGDHAQGMTVAVSNDMVRLYKTLFGRGPTKSQSHLAGADVYCAPLYDSLIARMCSMPSLTNAFSGRFV